MRATWQFSRFHCSRGLSVPDSLGRVPCPRAIRAGNRAESDIEAIRTVDRHDRQCQIHQFLLAEPGAGLVINLIRHMALGYERESLGPGEGRALTIAVEGRLSPGIKQIKPLFALAVGS